MPMFPGTSDFSENTKNLYDFIIRGIRLTFANGVAPVVVDVGINTEESVDGKGIVRQKNKIVDIGDLSGYSSFHAFDAKGKSVDGSEIVMEGVVDLEKLVLGMKRC